MALELNAYLHFGGNCRQAFEAYARVFRGTIEAMLTHADAPEGQQGAPESKDLIMHARLRVGDRVLMGSDAPVQMRQPMSGFSVTCGVPEPAEAERIFAALAEGGTVHMPIQETFWAIRFGMVVDRFGVPWMVNCERPA
ncbi:MAG TPA: VOC family protein [Candidatus Binatia bacterium]|nr:VOC family protein [Candidatus Binatia bacterium]